MEQNSVKNFRRFWGTYRPQVLYYKLKIIYSTGTLYFMPLTTVRVSHALYDYFEFKIAHFS